MSKKKNTLKDLDEFLKQQAATIVPPSRLSEKIAPPPTPTAENTSIDKVISDLALLMEQEGTAFRKKLYDIIIRSTESMKESLPEDKMLINTAIYLKSGEQWKEAIVEYWRKKASA